MEILLLEMDVTQVALLKLDILEHQEAVQQQVLDQILVEMEE